MNDTFEFQLEIKKHAFNSEVLDVLKEDIWIRQQWPFVYILSSSREKEAYVGETINALSRLSSHLANQSRRNLDTLLLIWSDKFNKSATLDIESNLIKYLSGDERLKLQNLNAGQVGHNYHQKPAYQLIFQSIWKELMDMSFATHPLQEIDNSDLFKYSPYKELSFDQLVAVKQILRGLVDDRTTNIFVQGSAGTGKTVLAVYLLKLLYTDIWELEAYDNEVEDDELIKLTLQVKRKYPDFRIGFVVPMTSLRSTLRKVFGNVKGLRRGYVIGPSDVTKSEYDLLVVDESHRLRRRKGITNFGAHDANNASLGLGQSGTELDWIVMRSKKRIFFYDSKQSIRPSDVREEDFQRLINQPTALTVGLTSQLRVKGGADYIDYVQRLLTNHLTEDDTVFHSETYEFLLFDSFDEMAKRLTAKEKEYGLCRLVAGDSWQWVSRTTNKPDIQIGSYSYYWNRVTQDWINSDGAADEVGCIHTTQGYDLNYTAIIFGREITYNPTTKLIEIIPENYEDTKGKQGVEHEQELHDYIVNIYRTLMLRGIRGTYLFTEDKNLKSYLREHVEQYTNK